jgi:pimeloyl-ACP methyl ester carboxylesterase
MNLFYREFGEGPALIILHGLFGTSDNWQMLAKRFADDFHVYTIDQRNHGRSFHDDRFDYMALTNDLLSFFEQRNIEGASIIGHSMGGKVGMKFTSLYPDLVSKLVVVDIAPRYYPVHHRIIIDALLELTPERFSRRVDIDDQLSQKIKNPAIRQFLLKNLSRNKKGQFEWKINLDSINRNLDKIGQAIYPDNLILNDTLFLYGGASDYINDTDKLEIERIFLHVAMAKIEKAGHWVHADDPENFYSIVNDFLKS